MSRTTTIGVVGPSYWSYMAAVMAESLEKEIDAKRVKLGDIPKGVYNSAVGFFRLVLGAAGDNIPNNSPASLNAYVIAAKAVKGSSQPIKTDRELDDHLDRYRFFIESLQKPRKLSPEEVETARALRKFFLRLQQQGEAETYGRRNHFQEPPLMHRHL